MRSIGEAETGSNRRTSPVDDKQIRGWDEPQHDSQRDDDVTKESDNDSTRTRSKTMKAKILSAISVTTFILTGCSMDSIFDGGLPFTMFCFGVMAISGYFAFCGKGE